MRPQALVCPVRAKRTGCSPEFVGDSFRPGAGVEGLKISPNGAHLDYNFDTGSAGAAIVFTRTAGTWTQQTKLLASDKASQDSCGESVAIDGDTVVIGARSEDDSFIFENGAAYVFTRSAGNWMQLHYAQFSRTCTS